MSDSTLSACIADVKAKCELAASVLLDYVYQLEDMGATKESEELESIRRQLVDWSR